MPDEQNNSTQGQPHPHPDKGGGIFCHYDNTNVMHELHEQRQVLSFILLELRKLTNEPARVQAIKDATARLKASSDALTQTESENKGEL